jgi:D-alanyl-lipoteichoic acid acyltransferase DltB (MBOAT superfamily)
MSFLSLTFLIFAALTLLIYWLTPDRGRWVVLLVASLLFYGAGDWWYLPFVAITVLSTWLVARWMGQRAIRDEADLNAHRADMSREERKAFKAARKRIRCRILILGLVINFGLLAVLKYASFAVQTVNDITGLFHMTSLAVPSLILPLGISFYTFRSTAYLIDVYWGKAIPQENLARYALFITYFPAMVQGPICRYNDLAPALFGPHRLHGEDMSAGLVRVLWGYFKKVVVADTAMIAVQAIVADAETLGGMYTIILILVYSAVIYGDFTGGMDISIGLSRMMGIRLTENFCYPFSSVSTQEYWNRWHITMGSWFTDYVFYPLSVSGPMQKLGKWGRAHLGKAIGKRLPVYLATLLTWFLTGLWHGAAWNFIVWGLLNGVVILISNDCKKLYEGFHARFPRLATRRWYTDLCAVRTFLLMGLIRSLDCYRNVPVTFRAWGSMLWNFSSWADLTNGAVIQNLGLSPATWVMLGLSVLLIFSVCRADKRARAAGNAPIADRLSQHPVRWAMVCGGLVLVILLFGSYGIGFDASDFIYGQV